MIERDGETFFVRDIIEDLKSKISYDEAIMSLYRSIKETEEINKKYEELLKVNNDLFKRIDEAIRILNSAKNHYDNDKTNWAIERTLRVLKGSDSNVS